MTDTHGATPSSRLSIDHITLDGIRVIVLRGEIDHTGKEPFLQALLPPDGTAASASARTVLDLTQVTFMDSSGITVRVAAYQAATRAGGWLRIAGAQGSRPTRPAIVGLDTVIDCHPTLDDALTACLPAGWQVLEAPHDGMEAAARSR